MRSRLYSPIVLAALLLMPGLAQVSDEQRRICVSGASGGWVCGSEDSPPQARPTRLAPPPPPVFLADPRQAGQPGSPFAADAEFRDGIDGVQVPPGQRMPQGFIPGISAVEPDGPRLRTQPALASSPPATVSEPPAVAPPATLSEQPAPTDAVRLAAPATPDPRPVDADIEAVVNVDRESRAVFAPAPEPAGVVPAAPAPAETVRAAAADCLVAPVTAALGNREFLTLPANSYVLQLASSADQQPVATAACQSGLDRGQLYLLQIRRNAAPWWLLLWAPFDSAESARQALAAHDADASSAWPRRIGPLQSEARRVQH